MLRPLTGCRGTAARRDCVEKTERGAPQPDGNKEEVRTEVQAGPHPRPPPALSLQEGKYLPGGERARSDLQVAISSIVLHKFEEMSIKCFYLFHIIIQLFKVHSCNTWCGSHCDKVRVPLLRVPGGGDQLCVPLGRVGLPQGKAA